MFAVFVAPLILIGIGGPEQFMLLCAHGLGMLISAGLQGPAGLLLFLSIGVLYVRERESRRTLERDRETGKRAAEQIALQKTALTLANRLTADNARLIQWVQRKEARGESVPEAVRATANSLGAAISELNEAAFVKPYQVSQAEARRQAQSPLPGQPLTTRLQQCTARDNC